MKLTYFLESDHCCPPNTLKKGHRVRWQDDDTPMFGRIVSTSGNSVTVTDERFGTNETHVVTRNKIFQVLIETKVIWSKSRQVPALEPVVEAKHTLVGNKLDFTHDEEVEQVVLTKLDSHDVAKLILKASVMQAYVDVEHEAEKDKSYRDSEDADEQAKAVDVKTVAEKADEIAYSFADAVKEIVSGTHKDVFEGLIKHYFPDLS